MKLGRNGVVVGAVSVIVKYSQRFVASSSVGVMAIVAG